MKKKYNFSAGPAAIPYEVLLKAQEQFVNYHDYGLSLLELSHRGKLYETVHTRCIQLLKDIWQIPDTHQILLLGGGATLQFGMVPMNLIYNDYNSVGIALSGAWAKKAYMDLQLYTNNIHIAFDGEDSKYHSLPDALDISQNAVYLHICSNETIDGIQWKIFPKVPCPIVADMSSDALSRFIDWQQFGLVYAGAQKNLGPAGLCLVVIRKDILNQCNESIPAYLRYGLHAENNSLYNTPPSFAVYMVMLQLEWLKELGGIAAIEKQNRIKAETLYQFIDSSKGFYWNPVEKSSRSEMNVIFLLRDTELNSVFLAEAEEHGIEGLKGHRSVGGMRASIYNAVSLADVEFLVDFMADFQTKNS